MNNIFLSLLLTSITVSCSSFSVSKPKIKSAETFTLKNAPVIGKTYSNQAIKLGGFSGLQFFDKRDDHLYFYVISDKGPTVDSKEKERIFLLPEFNHKIKILKTDKKTQEIEVSGGVSLVGDDKKNILGLPINRNEHNPLDVFGLINSINPNSIDAQALTADNEGGWWIADQYIPSLVQVSVEGRVLKRLTANNGLPRMYLEKNPNNGFTALARFNSRLFAFLPNFEHEQKTGEKRNIRILEASSDSMRTVDEYFYQLDNSKNIITAAAALESDKLIVFEKSNDDQFKKLFVIEIGTGDQLVKKHLLLDLNQTELKTVKNLSALTIVDGKTLAFATDNNYEIAGVTDLKTGLTPMSEKLSQLIVIEFEKNILK